MARKKSIKAFPRHPSKFYRAGFPLEGGEGGGHRAQAVCPPPLKACPPPLIPPPIQIWSPPFPYAIELEPLRKGSLTVEIYPFFSCVSSSRIWNFTDKLTKRQTLSSFSNFFNLFQTFKLSNFLKLSQTFSNLLKLFQTFSNFFKLFQTFSNFFKLFQTFSNFCKLFQTFLNCQTFQTFHTFQPFKLLKFLHTHLLVPRTCFCCCKNQYSSGQLHWFLLYFEFTAWKNS